MSSERVILTVVKDRPDIAPGYRLMRDATISMQTIDNYRGHAGDLLYGILQGIRSEIEAYENATRAHKANLP